MAYDDVILAMGQLGPYQRRIFVLLSLPLITYNFQKMVGVFLAAEQDFRCLLPQENPEDATYQLPPNITNATNPWNDQSNNWPQCERPDPDFKNPSNTSGERLPSMTPTLKCDSFVYDRSTYELTTTSEFDLVCDKAWLRPTADSLFLLGSMLGLMIFSGLSDRYGRKPIFCLTLLVQAISGLLVAASPEIISYMMFRLIVGAAISGVYLISYVSVVENFVPEKRLIAGISTELFIVPGYILTAGFAYFITNWRILQIAITLPCLVFLVYWWFIPESVRWLVTTGRLEEAKAIIEKASLENDVELPRARLDSMLSNCSVNKSDLEKLSVFDLFRYPSLRRKSLLLFFNWFVNNSIYFGLSWNTSRLPGDDYVNFAIGGLVEIPAPIIVLLASNRLGRKIILCTSMLFAGTSLLLLTLVPNDIPWLEVVLTMGGKLGITVSFLVLFIFTCEQYPTVIRGVGMGFCSTFGMIGGILSSFVNYSSVIWQPLPFVIFGSFSLIAGLSAMLLPETLNEKLPESIEDGENLGKKGKRFAKTSSNRTVFVIKLPET